MRIRDENDETPRDVSFDEANENFRDICFDEDNIRAIITRNGCIDEKTIALVEKLAGNEDDPPCFFDWHISRLLAVANDQNFISIQPAAPFVINKYPIDEQFLRISILTFIIGNQNINIIETSVLPCALRQFANVCSNASGLCQHPWMISANHFSPIFPIASIFVPRPRSNNVDRICNDLLPLNGVPLFH